MTFSEYTVSYINLVSFLSNRKGSDSLEIPTCYGTISGLIVCVDDILNYGDLSTVDRCTVAAFSLIKNYQRYNMSSSKPEKSMWSGVDTTKKNFDKVFMEHVKSKVTSYSTTECQLLIDMLNDANDKKIIDLCCDYERVDFRSMIKKSDKKEVYVL